MSTSRPASNPISYHKHTKQYYVTRGGKRIYLGYDKDKALKRYHQLSLDFEPIQKELALPVGITIKDLANRFITAQQANWRNPKITLKCYKDWLGRFIPITEVRVAKAIRHCVVKPVPRSFARRAKK